MLMQHNPRAARSVNLMHAYTGICIYLRKPVYSRVTSLPTLYVNPLLIYCLCNGVYDVCTGIGLYHVQTSFGDCNVIVVERILRFSVTNNDELIIRVGNVFR